MLQYVYHKLDCICGATLLFPDQQNVNRVRNILPQTSTESGTYCRKESPAMMLRQKVSHTRKTDGTCV